MRIGTEILYLWLVLTHLKQMILVLQLFWVYEHAVMIVQPYRLHQRVQCLLMCLLILVD